MTEASPKLSIGTKKSASKFACPPPFKGQFTDKVLDLNNVVMVDVPANFTWKLQPMDVSVNKPIKDHMRSSFQKWYAHQVKLQNGNYEPVDLRLSVLKNL